MFSALPRVLRGSSVIVGSASFSDAAKASPKTGNPPPGVAVASESLMGSSETSVAQEAAAIASAARLIDLDIGFPHDARPFREVFLDVGAEFLRRVGDGIRADLREALED